MKKLSPFWQSIAEDIMSVYGKGHPSGWNTQAMKTFLVDLEEKLIKKSEDNYQVAKLIGVPFIRGRYAIEHWKAIHHSNFRKIFITKESQGRPTTRQQFAIYLGYESAEQYMNQQKIQFAPTANVPLTIAPVDSTDPVLFMRIGQNEKSEWHLALEQNVADQQGSLSVPTPLPLMDTLLKDLELFYFLRNKLTGKPAHQSEELTSQNLKAFDEVKTKITGQLYPALFPEKSALRPRMDTFLEWLDKGKIAQLTVVISSDWPEILHIPFELIQQPTAQTPLVIAHDNLLLTRSEEEDLQSFLNSSKQSPSPTLRILFVTALPPGLSGQFMDLEREQELVFNAIDAADQQFIQSLSDIPKTKRVQIEFLEIGSLAAIDRALSKGAHHIVHISGHGFYYHDKIKEPEGYLNLETAQGELAQVSAKELAAVLKPYRLHLKLVIIAACESGHSGQNSVATTLLKSGVPAVLAMRYPVLDATVTLFTASLYEHLTLGKSILESFFKARQVIWHSEKTPAYASGKRPAEWDVPCLFLNQPVEKLLDINQPPQLNFSLHQIPRSGINFKGVRDGKLEPVPAKLIAHGFVGRRRLLARLTNLFDSKNSGRPDRKTICIHGLGGIGKTSLAARFMDNYKNKGFKIIEFVGKVSPEGIMLKIAESTNRPELKQELINIVKEKELDWEGKLNYLLHGFLKNAKTILFFDNFEDNQIGKEKEPKQDGKAHPGNINLDTLASFLKRLCEKIQALNGNAYLIFTTRYKPRQLPLHFIDLPQMTFPEVYKLLNRFIGLATFGLTERIAVFERIGGHPRALSLLNSYFRHSNDVQWTDMEAGFERAANSLANHDLLLGLLWEKLDEKEKETLCMASIFRTQTYEDGLVQLSGATTETVKRLLTTLQDLSLVFREDEMFFVHRLTSQWCLKKIDAATQKSWHHKAANYFQYVIGQSGPSLHSDLSRNIIWHFHQAEMENEHAGACLALSKALASQGMYHEALETMRSVSKESIEENLLIEVLGNLSALYSDVGKIKKAIDTGNYLHTVASRTQSPVALGFSHQILARAYLHIDDYQQAIFHYSQASASFEKADHPVGLSTCLSGLANVMLMLGKWEEALHLINSNLQISDLSGQGTCYHQMGVIEQRRNNYDEATEHYQKSIKISIELNDLQGLLATYRQLGNLQLELGRPEEAFKFYEQNLQVWEKTDDLKGQAGELHQVGRALQDFGKYQLALQYYLQSLDLRKRVHDRWGIMACHQQIGNIYLLQFVESDNPPLLEEAGNHYQKALNLFSSLGTDHKTKGDILHQLAMISHFKNEDFQLTLDKYLEALQIKQNIDDTVGMAATYNQIGELYKREEKWKEAIDFYKKSMALRKTLSNPRLIAGTAYQLGEAHLAIEDRHHALAYFEMGYQYYLATGNKLQQTLSLILIGAINHELENPDKALHSFNEISKANLPVSKEQQSLINEYLRKLKSNDNVK
ncbi:MAG: tetratricopeptide repeat protein [Bacteroidota bacterium]